MRILTLLNAYIIIIIIIIRESLLYINYYATKFTSTFLLCCIIMLQMLLYSCTELGQLSGVAAILRFPLPESEDSQDSDSD